MMTAREARERANKLHAQNTRPSEQITLFDGTIIHRIIPGKYHDIGMEKNITVKGRKITIVMTAWQNGHALWEERVVQPLIITAQVINVTCRCGGPCSNEHGSTMIEHFDKTVRCTWCDAQYEVPSSAFQKTLLVK